MNAIARARLYSPYLAESLELFPEISDQIGGGYGDCLRRLYQTIPSEIGSLSDEMTSLRILKRKAHLVIALADIGRIWRWDQVTEALTELADFCLLRILRASAEAQLIEGTEENPVPGLFVLAVGKYGARELNYSSDIDFNVFYDPKLIKVPNPARAERTLIKLVQGVIKGMEAITEHGYIFRTDLRLRPDPRSNAIAVSTSTAERYYETLGQNWERAAMIKARICAGDFEAGQAFIDQTLRPFIWRKNMDYAAIEDILAIKRQIHAKIGAGQNLTLSGHNLKLGYGGIREIEFYAQVQQLILGGRHESLRCIRTVDALSELARLGYISRSNADLLIVAYSDLRTAEHALQMINDQQTHNVPDGEIEQNQFSGLMGEPDFVSLSAKLEKTLRSVRHTYMDLFPESGSLSSREGNMVFTGVEPDPSTLETFAKLGYQDGETVWCDMADWLGGRIRATRAERARELLTILAPVIIENCADTGQADIAFDRFRRFFTSLGSGVSLLSMFNQRPEHLQYIINLMTQSELISSWISDKPAILDALSDPEFLHVTEENISHGQILIRDAEDFEAALNQSRRWVRESKFRITAGLLSKRLNEKNAGKLFSKLAEITIESLLPHAIKEAERRGSKIQGEIAVMGLGKLASRELNLNSDLDIMLIYQPGINEDAAQSFYTRVTQRLISALSAVTEEGPLYEVDMALRPSGRSGPVAVSMQAFETYYQNNAWSWEFMALSRSRVICATSKSFKENVIAKRIGLLRYPRPDLNMPRDISDMLNRVRREKQATHFLDLKNIRGGIRDIEFIAQKLYLEQRFDSRVDGPNISEIFEECLGQSDPETASLLWSCYDYFLAILQQLAIRSHNAHVKPDDQLVRDIAKIMGFASEQMFENDLEKRRGQVSTCVDEIIMQRKD